ICAHRRGIDWGFNAWGGEYDGLYAHYDRDALVAEKLCEVLGDARIDMRDFILEGGSIHVDGEGTLITTEECLLSPGRNPKLSNEEIEDVLRKTLGAEKIIWLPTGVYNDETNGHVDNFCCFSAPGEVLLAWTDNENDPNYESCRKAFGILSSERDSRGRSLKIRKLPFPEEPVVITEKDLEGYVFEEGEDTREAGERLAASYVNFYISNGAVIYPRFGENNRQSDEYAGKVLAEAFPGREVIGVDARVILLGGGNIHCITQQIPARKR
nr:agmatine deiminase family protein [Lachnospiraceae bacterium]